MKDEFRFRRAESEDDAERLKAHFSEVYFDGVGIHTATMFHRYPRMKNEYWFIAEQRGAKKIAAAFMLIPWVWEMEEVRLKVAQMVGAATLPQFRRQGLIRELIAGFEQTLADDDFDLAVINGIRGFYRQFGFCFALPVENHVKLKLDMIPDSGQAAYDFRLAEESDIPFLMDQDKAYRSFFSVSSYRDEAAWEYLLNDRFHTMYGSEFWLMEQRESGERFYCRMPLNSHFGSRGLQVSEVSQGISEEALDDLLAFFRRQAAEREKPYIRLNLHEESPAAQRALALGASNERQSAWQVKIPDPVRFVTRIAAVLEQRLEQSDLKRYTGAFRLDFHKYSLDLMWEGGKLATIDPGEGRQKHGLRVYEQLFPLICLGHRSWPELARVWPDVGPAYGDSARLIAALFPARRSWLYEPA